MSVAALIAVGPAPDAAALAEAMRETAARLEPPRRRVEAAFTELAARLGDGAGVAAELGAVASDAVAHLREADLDETVASLRAVADAAAAIGARFTAERASMEELGAAIGAGGRPLDSLDRAIRTIGIIATVARVASAPLASASNDIGFFSTDLVRLADDAGQSVRAFSDTYRRIVQEVQEASLRQARFEHAYRDRLLDLPRRFDLRLTAVAEHRRAGEAAGEALNETSREVTRRISEAVSALQVGDAARQRIEHVEAGLLHLADAASALPPDALRLGAALQAALLEEATEVFSVEAEAARRRVHELAEDASRILASGRQALFDASGGASPLDALQDELLAATDLLRACERERRELDGLARAVSTAIARLFEQLEHVQATEVEMQLLAVNAAIRCSRLGADGRALSVISEQLTDLTNETRRAVKLASEELARAAGPAEAIAGVAADGRSDEISRLETEARASVDRLLALDAEMRAAGEALDRQGPRASDFLRRAAASFDALDAVHADLAPGRDRLRPWARLPAEPGSPSPEAEALFADLRRTYSIEAERRIHDRIVGAASEAPAATETASDDWEMFG